MGVKSAQELRKMNKVKLSIRKPYQSMYLAAGTLNSSLIQGKIGRHTHSLHPLLSNTHSDSPQREKRAGAVLGIPCCHHLCLLSNLENPCVVFIPKMSYSHSV
ncbi:unnamed protein product [Prunus brigantina]